MKSFFAALALAGATAFPMLAHAMDDMTCAAFTAMDADGQMETLGMMQGDGMAAGGAMAAGDAMMADEATTKTVGMACSEHPDMMLGDAMKGAMGN